MLRTTRDALDEQHSGLVFSVVVLVDSLDLEDRFKDVAYRNAMIHVSNLFMVGSFILFERRC